MASRMSTAAELVARVKRVGWTVTTTRDGAWKVKCSDDFVVQIHRTPSDTNAAATVLRALNAHGLKAAEQAATEREEAERVAKLEAGRVAADRKTKAVVAREKLLARAAGPYAPAQVALAEILRKHPAPRTYERVFVTPEMAAAMLERGEPVTLPDGTAKKNLPLRKAWLNELCKILSGGRWKYLHHAIAFDEDGWLQDGRHRLTAIVTTGVGAELLIAVGMSRENYSAVDTGGKRTAARVLAGLGVASSAWTAAAVKLLYLHEVYGAELLEHGSEAVQPDLIMDTYQALNKEGDVDAAVRLIARLRSEVPSTNPSGAVAGLYLVMRACPDRGLALGYAEAVIRGNEPGDPSFEVRRQIIRERLPRAEMAALMVSGWNKRLGDKGPVSHRRSNGMPTPMAPGEVSRRLKVAA